jgi:hypothetical protein
LKPSTAFLLAFAAVALPTASVAGAAELEWNQERVTAPARPLIEPVEKLEADLESRPPVPGKEEAHAAVEGDLERLNPRARELAQRLARGAGQDETVALFREVEARHARPHRPGAEDPDPARSVLRALVGGGWHVMKRDPAVSNRSHLHVLSLLAVALLLFAAPKSRAELATWDQGRVRGLSKELTTASEALYETFLKQPPPTVGSMQTQAYYRLEQRLPGARPPSERRARRDPVAR